MIVTRMADGQSLDRAVILALMARRGERLGRWRAAPKPAPRPGHPAGDLPGIGDLPVEAVLTGLFATVGRRPG